MINQLNAHTRNFSWNDAEKATHFVHCCNYIKSGLIIFLPTLLKTLVHQSSRQFDHFFF